MMRSKKSQHVVFCLACSLLIAFISLAPALIQGETETVRTKIVTITGKTMHAIIVGERQMKLTEKTIILGLNGKPIPIEDLPIPCSAEVKYQLFMDKNPEAIQVVVQKLFPGSSPDYIFHVREQR